MEEEAKEKKGEREMREIPQHSVAGPNLGERGVVCPKYTQNIGNELASAKGRQAPALRIRERSPENRPGSWLCQQPHLIAVIVLCFPGLQENPAECCTP